MRNVVVRTAIENLESRQLLSASALSDLQDITVTPARHHSSTTSATLNTTIDGYTPEQIRKAYGFDQIILANGASADGTGQTIAIVTAYNDPNISSDLHAFDAAMGIDDPLSLSVVSQTGGKVRSIATDAGWAGETALDIEWAHAIAPDAKILLVEAKSASLSDLLTAVDYARNADNVSVVSMSWGADEFWSETSFDKYFTTPADHQGVTFVAASGDEGSWWGPTWPSSSSNVLAVGGTTLNIDATGAAAGETAWNDSGGGFSSYEDAPDYQANVQRTGARSAPDVSYNANPYTGFAFYNTVDDGSGRIGWDVVGGTSAGAPQWAALVAIANQGRAAVGKASLDGATGTLPALYSLYNDPAAYSQAFNDITRGRSSYYTSSRYGYDAVTGLGTPKAAGVVDALVGNLTPVAANASTIVSASRRARAQLVRRASPAQEATTTATVPVTAPTPAAPPTPARPADDAILAPDTLANPRRLDSSLAATSLALSSTDFGNRDRFSSRRISVAYSAGYETKAQEALVAYAPPATSTSNGPIARAVGESAGPWIVSGTQSIAPLASPEIGNSLLERDLSPLPAPIASAGLVANPFLIIPRLVAVASVAVAAEVFLYYRGLRRNKLAARQQATMASIDPIEEPYLNDDR